MPIFQYKCKKCGHVMDFLESSSKKVEHKCEKCGSSDMQKQLSSFSCGQSSNGSDSSCPTGTCPFS